MSVSRILGQNFADRLGILVSGLCAIHCALTPLLILLLPSVSFIPHSEELHLGLAAAIPLISIAAFVPGFRIHRDPRVLGYMVVGLICVWIGAINPWEALSFVTSSFVTLTGSAFLIAAHRRNRRLKRCCPKTAPRAGR